MLAARATFVAVSTTRVASPPVVRVGVKLDCPERNPTSVARLDALEQGEHGAAFRHNLAVVALVCPVVLIVHVRKRLLSIYFLATPGPRLAPDLAIFFPGVPLPKKSFGEITDRMASCAERSSGALL